MWTAIAVSVAAGQMTGFLAIDQCINLYGGGGESDRGDFISFIEQN